ncbi:MAG TPA: fasciclin domain-containing protein [Clostridia bacterium]|nr:fasciclin domain-containing protein [Clostridia bacterium]
MLNNEIKNIYETVLALDYFKILTQIIQKAGQTEKLSKEGPFTLFGPHDGAFYTFTTYDPNDIAHEIAVITLEEILASKKAAEEILNYLLVPERYTLSDLRTFTSITAVNNQNIPIEITNGNIIPGNSDLMNTDIECSNGIIHVTGSVLRPTL